jgi:hypothetical protein
MRRTNYQYLQLQVHKEDFSVGVISISQSQVYSSVGLNYLVSTLSCRVVYLVEV